MCLVLVLCRSNFISRFAGACVLSYPILLSRLVLLLSLVFLVSVLVCVFSCLFHSVSSSLCLYWQRFVGQIEGGGGGGERGYFFVFTPLEMGLFDVLLVSTVNSSHPLHVHLQEETSNLLIFSPADPSFIAFLVGLLSGQTTSHSMNSTDRCEATN